MRNLYLLDECPLVMSIGHLVSNFGFSFHWTPSDLPWLASPEGDYLQAHRIVASIMVYLRFPRRGGVRTFPSLSLLNLQSPVLCLRRARTMLRGMGGTKGGKDGLTICRPTI